MRAKAYTEQNSLAARTDDWLTHIRRTVAPRPHLKPRIPDCALLIVDMLHYFGSPDGRSYLPASSAIVPNIQALLEAWRARNGLVVFTRHCHQGPQDLGMLGKFFSDYIRCGKLESEILEALAPRPSERVFRKTTYDAFLGTGLESYLFDQGVSQVLVTGVLTHMCCETSARSAFCRGFEVFVAADGTASSRESLHVGSLMAMADSVAVVFKTQEILELVDSHNAHVLEER